MQNISSKDNEYVKHLKKLKDKKYRDISMEYIVEGIKIVEEAINEKAKIKQIVICDECEKNSSISKELMLKIAKHECIYVTKEIFERITGVLNPQGILAVIEKNSKETSKINYEEDLIVMLDDIQDPGNLGTILRTLDSANISQVVISKNSADPYNPKVVRSTMGAIFRVNILECDDLIEKIKELKKYKYKTVITCLETNNSIYDINFNKKILVIGNEANGVRKEIIDLADYKAKIPMLGKTESLNASVATGIIVYEYVRQKINEK